MALKKDLLRFARSVVQNVIRQINQQASIVEEQINTEIVNWVKSLTQTTWRGRGADRFIEEINTFIIPRGKLINQSLIVFNSQIQHAIPILDQADMLVKQLAVNLGDIFDDIYKG